MYKLSHLKVKDYYSLGLDMTDNLHNSDIIKNKNSRKKIDE